MVPPLILFVAQSLAVESFVVSFPDGTRGRCPSTVVQETTEVQTPAGPGRGWAAYCLSGALRLTITSYSTREREAALTIAVHADRIRRIVGREAKIVEQDLRPDGGFDVRVNGPRHSLRARAWIVGNRVVTAYVTRRHQLVGGGSLDDKVVQDFLDAAAPS